MAIQPTLFADVAGLLEALPSAQLVEVARGAALDGLDSISQLHLRGHILTDIVAGLFPEFSPSQVAEAAQHIRLNAVKNACWKSVMAVPGRWEVGIGSPDREATEALRARQGPAILVFWHFGPVTMLTIALRHIGVPVLAVSTAAPTRWTNAEDLLKMRINLAGSNPRQTAVALRQLLGHLKSGGKVAVALDGRMGKQDLMVPFFGRRIPVSRGAAGLARLTGAPLIPCTMQWKRGDWNMALRVFDPLPQPSVPREDVEAFERETLTAAVRCFEDFGRRHPGQFRMDQLAHIFDCPKIGF